MQQLKIWIISNNQTIWSSMNQFWSGIECERAHTLTTTATASKCSHKKANNQTDYQSHNSLPPPPPPPPPKVPSLQDLALG